MSRSDFRVYCPAAKLSSKRVIWKQCVNKNKNYIYLNNEIGICQENLYKLITSVLLSVLLTISYSAFSHPGEDHDELAATLQIF